MPLRLTFFLGLALIMVGAYPFLSKETKQTKDIRSTFKAPEFVHYPDSNPYSEEKETLGEKLFFDPLLSGNGQMSCATCHNPSLGWGNGKPRAIGHDGSVLGRKVPTLYNVAFGKTFFWDGRAGSLEEQALGPIQSPDEMNMPASFPNEAWLGLQPSLTQSFAHNVGDGAGEGRLRDGFGGDGVDVHVPGHHDGRRRRVQGHPGRVVQLRRVQQQRAL